MLDFASALYLGLRHAHDELTPWSALTSGRPASAQPPGAPARLEPALAEWLGSEDACLATSTLHLFWDLFEVLIEHATAALPGRCLAVYVDAGCYPIARWGAQRVAQHGIPIHRFDRHDTAALERLLRQSCWHGQRPIILADGMDPATGEVAPLAGYLALARRYDGWVVVDDTQALGVLGRRPSVMAPYGQDGSGCAGWLGVVGPELVRGASLAKGLGVPVAVLAGECRLVQRFRATAPTRTHCSPPSAAALAATARAMAIQRRAGSTLRASLHAHVQQFRRGATAIGLRVAGGVFPVQTPVLGPVASQVHAHLLRHGVETVLHRARPGWPAQMSFLIRADHHPAEIDAALGLLAEAVFLYIGSSRSRSLEHESLA